MLPSDPKTLTAMSGLFYRDTLLPPNILSMYKTGILFREPTYCDATYKFGGLAAPHRFLINSETATCIDSCSQHPEWGLCVWKRGSIFKVIDVQQINHFSQITLFEIQEIDLSKHLHGNSTRKELVLVKQASNSFKEALQTRPLPEHSKSDWLERLAFPLGIDDDGHFFEAWAQTPSNVHPS